MKSFIRLVQKGEFTVHFPRYISMSLCDFSLTLMNQLVYVHVQSPHTDS